MAKPELSEQGREDMARHLSAQRRMQSGVAWSEGLDEHPEASKHLRVGVNSAMCDHAALVELLVAKGVITPDEYAKAIADRMDQEASDYAKEISARVGRPVSLGEAGIG